MEVRDARMPLSSACAYIEPFIQNRRRLIILNKCDLTDPKENQKWASYFSTRGQATEFVNALSGARVSELMPPALRNRGLITTRADRSLLIMIIGLPNTGKSTVINAMRSKGWISTHHGASSNVAKTGAKPGITRSVTTIQFYSDPPAFLIDTPGIMSTQVDQQVGMKLALIGSIKETIVPPTVLAGYLLECLNLKSQHEYARKHGLPSPVDNVTDLLTAIALKQGFRLKTSPADRPLPGEGPVGPTPTAASAAHGRSAAEGARCGTLDLDKAAMLLVQQYRRGDLGRFVLDDLPPGPAL